MSQAVWRFVFQVIFLFGFRQAYLFLFAVQYVDLVGYNVFLQLVFGFFSRFVGIVFQGGDFQDVLDKDEREAQVVQDFRVFLLGGIRVIEEFWSQVLIRGGWGRGRGVFRLERFLFSFFCRVYIFVVQGWLCSEVCMFQLADSDVVRFFVCFQFQFLFL